jgi:phenylpyruvate tautomerase PptA (4-oxalocrotonate tautomerase family)
MPLVTITVRRGRSEVETQAISEGIHRSLVEEIGIPDADFNHRILELDAAHWHLPAGRSERLVCVEIRMYPGRTAEMKRALFRSIARKLEAFGIAAEDVFVVIDEPPRENWSVSVAAAEAQEKKR